MKSHRLLFTAALLAALVGSPLLLSAAEHGHERARAHQQRREMMAERIGEKLNLTDAQKEQFKALRKQQRDEMRKLHDEAEDVRADFRERGRALRKKYEEQRRAILTPEQQKQLDEMKANWREHAQERRHGKFGPGKRGAAGDRDERPDADDDTSN